MSVTVRTSVRADAEIQRAGAWWRANRPAHADLFERELRAALQQLTTAPESGSIARIRGRSVTRRVRLVKTQHVLYYRFLPESQVLYLVALRHGRRGRQPF